MKRAFLLLLICAIITAFLCSCQKKTDFGDFDWDKEYTLPVELGDVSDKLSFDFGEKGLIVQTEQYGKCRIEVTGKESSAEVVVSGKNLCGGAPGTTLPRQYNGITYTNSADGGIMVNGTATGNSVCYVAGRWGANTTDADRIFLPEGTYSLSGCPAGGGDTTYHLSLAVVNSEGKITYHVDEGAGVTFTLRESAYVGVCVQVLAGTAVDGLVFAPQIEIGDQATCGCFWFRKKG